MRQYATKQFTAKLLAHVSTISPVSRERESAVAADRSPSIVMTAHATPTSQ
jgi:hypothetical protein